MVSSDAKPAATTIKPDATAEQHPVVSSNTNQAATTIKPDALAEQHPVAGSIESLHGPKEAVNDIKSVPSAERRSIAYISSVRKPSYCSLSTAFLRDHEMLSEHTSCVHVSKFGPLLSMHASTS